MLEDTIRCLARTRSAIMCGRFVSSRFLPRPLIDRAGGSCGATSFTLEFTGASYSRMKQARTALRFFFHVTLGRNGFGDRMARIPTPERLPVVLSTEEIALLLAARAEPEGTGRRSASPMVAACASRIAHVKVSDIDSARMLIRVEQGKGREDRYVMPRPTCSLICCGTGGG